MKTLKLGLALFFCFAGLAAGAAPALASSNLVATRTVDFVRDQRIPLDVRVGDLRVTHLRIAADDAPLLDQVLPPSGGQRRFSWLRYEVGVENPSERSRNLEARIELLDENGAVIDEFGFDGRAWRGRARTIDIKRITLNYAIPLIAEVRITVSAL